MVGDASSAEIAAPWWRHPAHGLRHNPFGAPFGFERAALAVPTIDLDLVARLARRPAAVVELVGRPGSGKTTHLHAIAAALGDAAIVRIPATGRAPPLPRHPIVLVDEAQRLSFAQRISLLRADASFVLATHRSLAPWLRLLGRRVESMPITGLPSDGLARYVDLRLRWASEPHRLGPRIPGRLLAELLSRHGGDVRAIESSLYAWAEGTS